MYIVSQLFCDVPVNMNPPPPTEIGNSDKCSIFADLVNNYPIYRQN